MFKCEKHILNFTTLKNNIFFTSDTHFGHANIIKYAHRPYAEVDEMNKTLIDNWNSVVSNEDLGYFRLVMSRASSLDLCHDEKMYKEILFPVPDGGYAEGALH